MQKSGNSPVCISFTQVSIQQEVRRFALKSVFKSSIITNVFEASKAVILQKMTPVTDILLYLSYIYIYIILYFY